MTKISKVGALLVLGSIALTGCGSSDGSGSDGSTKSGASASAQPSMPPGGGISSAQLNAIRTCLKAAGLGDALPTGMPSGAPDGAPPGGMPDGAPPSGAPNGGPPSGAPSGAGQMQDPQVQAALKACGINLQR